MGFIWVLLCSLVVLVVACSIALITARAIYFLKRDVDPIYAIRNPFSKTLKEIIDEREKNTQDYRTLS